jgi:hypothetical protein
MSDEQPFIISNALSSYEDRVAEFNRSILANEALSKRLIAFRIGSALPGLLFIFFGLAERSMGNWVWQLGIVLIIVFLAFAAWYETVQWRISQTRSQLFGFERLIHRCHRNWNSLNALPAERESIAFTTDWTRDLDLFGDRSLFRWYSLAMTRIGSKTICKWFTEWTPIESILERQQATKELSEHRDWRLRCFQICCGLRDLRTSPEAIAEWSHSEDFFSRTKWLYPLTWLGPALIGCGLLLLVSSINLDNNLGQSIGLITMVSGFLLNIAITIAIMGSIHDLFHRIGSANRELVILLDWIHAIGDMSHQSSLLKRLYSNLFDRELKADLAIRKLQKGMFLAGFQKSPLFFIPYVLLQLLILWDVRVLRRLESWKRIYGMSTQRWMDSLGELEAIISSATIADEYPSWCFPDIQGRGSLLVTEHVAHPLLKDSQRVPNDLKIDQNQRLLLVTGSNMAGKSTLLRSIGINAILSRTGSPICALKWTSEAFEIATSIRVQDSLQDGVSFFMAELKRLKSVVDLAVSENPKDGRRILVLLDEILQGTNSRERQIAVDTVLKRLVDLECIVLTSTHDLELATNEQMKSRAQVVHFREYFELIDGKQIMRFDYKMRPGVTPTTNALKLLEMVGL